MTHLSPMFGATRLSRQDLDHAVYLWRQEKDTNQIAKILGIAESAVANSLGAWRDEEWKRRHQ